MNYDLIIIGAGPGGYEAAAAAGKSGLKTLLIEKNKLGGVCLNCGCIPTKTLLATVHFYRNIQKRANLFNIRINEAVLDYPKVIERKDRLLIRMHKGIELLLKESQVEVILGEAQLLPDKQVRVNDKTFTASNIILATGSEPGLLPNLTIDNQKTFDPTGLLNLKELPKSISIIGAGVIGLEFADVFSSLGIKVYLSDILETVLPNEDREAVEAIVKALQQNGCEFFLGPKAAAPAAEITLCAAGRLINTDYIQDPGLSKAAKGLKVNDNLKTSIPGVYAIGDLNNLSLFAHSATAQGLHVVKNILQKSATPFKLSNIPSVIFTRLQYATVGKRSDQAEIKKIPLQKLGRAQAENISEGFIKLFINKNTQIIEGVVIVGENAEALIGEAIVLVNKQVKYSELSNMIHPHPAWAEWFILE